MNARPAARVRVAHVLASLKGYGAEQFVLRLLPRLPRHGIDAAAVTVYSSSFGNGTPAPDGIPVFDAARRHRYDARFFGRVVAALREWRPDIVHTHTHNGKYWGRLAALVAGVPIIVHTEHDPNFSARGVERLFDAVLERRTRRFIAFSEEHRLRLAAAERIDVEKIAVIPNGIIQFEPEPGARARGRVASEAGPDELLVTMVGRLEAQKRHDVALRGFAALAADERDRARLVIVGHGSLEPDLRSLSRDLGIAERVTFKGYRRDVHDLLAAADVLLMTSMAEGMPIALIEAMAAGVPIVTAPWAGAREMLDDGAAGWLSVDWRPESIAAALRVALRDREGALAKASRAREKARALYDIETSARDHARLYRSLAGS
jgi:glycosyltransferase involved in cell wall biosynthesis